MAKLKTDRQGAFCSGCGERFHFIPFLLSSQFREPRFSAGGSTAGPELAEFAEAHADCRVGKGGLLIVERGRNRSDA